MFNWNDFMNDFPYTNFSDVNVSWFLNKFKQIFDEWEGLYNQMLSWKTATDVYNATWRTQQEQAFTTWETNFQTAIDAWKVQTETDIGTWETDTIATLEAWKAVFINQYNALRLEVEQIAEDAETAKNNAQASAQSAQASATSAQTNATYIIENAYSIEQLVKTANSNKPDDYIINTALDANGVISVNNNTYTTLFIDVSEFDKNNQYRFYVGYSELYRPIIAFYDENKTFISSLTTTSTNDRVTGSIPSTADYMRISTVKDYNIIIMELINSTPHLKWTNSKNYDYANKNLDIGLLLLAYNVGYLSNIGGKIADYISQGLDINLITFNPNTSIDSESGLIIGSSGTDRMASSEFTFNPNDYYILCDTDVNIGFYLYCYNNDEFISRLSIVQNGLHINNVPANANKFRILAIGSGSPRPAIVGHLDSKIFHFANLNTNEIYTMYVNEGGVI